MAERLAWLRQRDPPLFFPLVTALAVLLQGSGILLVRAGRFLGRLLRTTHRAWWPEPQAA